MTATCPIHDAPLRPVHLGTTLAGYTCSRCDAVPWNGGDESESRLERLNRLGEEYEASHHWEEKH